MSSFAQQTNFFEFPQRGSDYSQMMYAHPQNSYLPPQPQSPPYQLCELVYTPVPTPNGVALTPSLVPVNSVDGQVYGNPAPSPVPPQMNYMHAPMKRDGQEKNNGVNKVGDFYKWIS